MFCLTALPLPHVHAFSIYFDADRTSHLASALAIEQGFKVALAQNSNQLNGRPIQFVTLDHRGNVLRSKRNMDAFLADPDALIYVGGLHSPPLIKYREFINQQGILTLVPWAAGDPITRYPSPNNFVFRLSVDDSKVGKILFDYALSQGCKSPHLLLEETGWGKSNYKNMNLAAELRGQDRPKVTWFSWGINEVDARLIMKDLVNSQAQCILMVANAREGALLVNASVAIDSRLPLYSHWGITGGNFAKNVSYEIREKAQLRFIRSCFNFYSSPETPISRAVYHQAQQLFPQQFVDKNIAAPAGFVHGYDLGKIVVAASQSVIFTSDIVENRKRLKQALETFDAPVDGLIKRYQQPFSVFSVENRDAHEALGPDDLCMAFYDTNNAVKLLSSAKSGANN
ncbi:ABC transporter substrate-binding protein [Vibrio sp. SM6]|uniref:ABC transporter substrate-binding protein n=1 Tax=Vibrio agarilyticus TaxID=2726741 RepID=A0A7X8TNJ9_9VIBR|nr:ABC transporter substrate-binding protein [Vibrio agarilyticus]